MKKALSKKKRKTGLILASIGVLIWTLYAYKDRNVSVNSPSADICEKKIVLNHIAHETGCLFGADAAGIVKTESGR